VTCQPTKVAAQMQQKNSLGIQNSINDKKAIFQQVSMTLCRQKCHLSTSRHDVATRESAITNEHDVATPQASKNVF